MLCNTPNDAGTPRVIEEVSDVPVRNSTWTPLMDVLRKEKKTPIEVECVPNDEQPQEQVRTPHWSPAQEPRHQNQQQQASIGTPRKSPKQTQRQASASMSEGIDDVMIPTPRTKTTPRTATTAEELGQLDAISALREENMRLREENLDMREERLWEARQQQRPPYVQEGRPEGLLDDADLQRCPIQTLSLPTESILTVPLTSPIVTRRSLTPPLHDTNSSQQFPSLNASYDNLLHVTGKVEPVMLELQPSETTASPPSVHMMEPPSRLPPFVRSPPTQVRLIGSPQMGARSTLPQNGPRSPQIPNQRAVSPSNELTAHALAGYTSQYRSSRGSSPEMRACNQQLQPTPTVPGPIVPGQSRLPPYTLGSRAFVGPPGRSVQRYPSSSPPPQQSVLRMQSQR